MSTSATIAIVNADKTVTMIWVSGDGYPGYMVPTLMRAEIDAIMKLGDIRGLQITPEECVPIRSSYKNSTTYPDLKSYMYGNVAEDTDFNYVRVDGKWHVMLSGLLFAFPTSKVA